MDQFMDDLLKEFLVESNENLDRLDRDLVQLEKNPTDGQLLASIFRAVHTIKGTCGFLGFVKLESVTHVGESLLAKLRDGKLLLDTDITNALLELIDSIRKILSTIEKQANDGNEDWSALINKFSTLLEREEITAEKIASNKNTMTDDLPAGESIATSNAVRVDVSLLDHLMNLVGELVLSRNQMLEIMSTHIDSNSLMTVSQRLNSITSELQNGVMKTRMQPIGNVWKKFPRIVRDLSTACGKKVKLELFGEETELDKTLIEAIKDPLSHILRNSIDHGIELPEKRKAAGKPEEGLLQIKAFHESGKVNIEIIDDGGGISPEKVKEKALSKNLITIEQAANMSERELINLVFLPGFSTAETITNISGRGVGMDVVRTNIESINGMIDIQSQAGKGTTIIIKIPLTLAIIPALVVMCDQQRYAIPQTSVLELIRHNNGDSGKHVIEHFQGAPVYRLRGRLLPLVYLNHQLQITNDEANNGANNIVVVQINDNSFGLVVDKVNDMQEIVVKPLDKQLKGLPVYAGATIMGDGQVALILDLLHIAQQCHLISDKKKSLALLDQHETIEETKTEGEDLLLVHGQDLGRMIIPLTHISRLEEIPRSDIETINSQDVVQYRGKIMPLVHLATAIPDRRSKPRTPAEEEARRHEMMQVVVYTKDHTNVGIVISKVIDIIHQKLVAERPGSRQGISGCMIVGDFVVEILNVEEIVNADNASLWQNNHTNENTTSASGETL